MAVFEYKGFDAKGAAAIGIVDADSPKGARTKLRRQGVFATDVYEQKGGGAATRGAGLNVSIDFRKSCNLARSGISPSVRIPAKESNSPSWGGVMESVQPTNVWIIRSLSSQRSKPPESRKSQYRIRLVPRSLKRGS